MVGGERQVIQINVLFRLRVDDYLAGIRFPRKTRNLVEIFEHCQQDDRFFPFAPDYKISYPIFYQFLMKDGWMYAAEQYPCFWKSLAHKLRSEGGACNFRSRCRKANYVIVAVDGGAGDNFLRSELQSLSVNNVCRNATLFENGSKNGKPYGWSHRFDDAPDVIPLDFTRRIDQKKTHGLIHRNRLYFTMHRRAEKPSFQLIFLPSP